MSRSIAHLIERDEKGRFICALCARRFKVRRDQNMSIGPALPVVLCRRCLYGRCRQDPELIIRALVRKLRAWWKVPLERRDIPWIQHLHRLNIALCRYAEGGAS